VSRSIPGAVVIGGYANAVGLVRGLGRRGIPVAVVRTMEQDIAHRSRFATEHTDRIDLDRAPDALLELLEHRARRWVGWVVLPTNDYALTLLARHHERLAKSYRLTSPPWEVTRRVLDKELLGRIAREIGVPTPRSFGPATRESLAQELAFPLLVKPAVGHTFAARFGRKLLVARDPAELRDAVARVEDAAQRCELLEWVPGRDDQFFAYQVYLDRRGEPRGGFARRKLRQAPPFFGVARAAEPVHAPELREPSIELLRRIEWRGVASVDYKRDPRDGSFRLLEINGRSILPNQLARRAGFDYALAAFHECTQGEPSGLEPNGWRGVWIHLHADLLYTAAFARRERLDWRTFLRSYAGPKTFAVWAADDPAPFALEWAHTVRKIPRMLVDRTARRALGARVQAVDAAAARGPR
jgi:predicted ATP-grasp superfamily ATP-dependent carboligase